MMSAKLTLLIIITLGLLFLFYSAFNSSELDDVLNGVREDYNVEHISNEKLGEMPAQSVVIFDVRKLKEYQVSHIQNAIHLAPNTSAEHFLSQYGSELKDKTVVFYCSVGQRSSRMLSMLSEELVKAGIKQAYNLEGGVFKWHNDNKSFVRDGKKTQDIHPYNAYWGRLINDKSSIKYDR